jgi:tRNA(Ile)-lysidine synthase
MGNSRKSNSVEYIRKQVGRFLDRHRSPELPLIIAYSGGLDSSVLLDAIAVCNPDKPLRLAAVHFHHGLSPNADDWATHCRDTCAAYSIPLDVAYLHVPADSGYGIEAAARRERYAAMNGYPACQVALGHHATDQAETVLMNLFRGSGTLGLSGMQAINGRYMRPLLDVGRETLVAYAQAARLRWIEDESNADPRFTRNYIRHSVLPVVQKRFPAMEVRLASSARHSAHAQRLLDELAEIDSDGHGLQFPFPIAAIRTLSDDRATNLLRALLTRSSLQCPPAARLTEFVRQLSSAGLDRHPELRLGTSRIHYRKGYLQVSETSRVSV